MSVVIYDAQENCLYADSLCVDNYHRMTIQKIFTYNLNGTNDTSPNAREMTFHAHWGGLVIPKSGMPLFMPICVVE
ncbi:hypothetical protein J8V57_14690 [Xenorhabdus sp. PB61.4]|uniref:hypothetical protein n=1 Tax=Xenorhabdus sp. PB61.4 TaxID=2788940 RepID=UPI001E4A162C|nr:hypothetical protein [Xenorhabdus sp. PB61.4]MCC8367502.1 hypothetical protein [Xenorhabdus sp. PB61.4]